MTEPSGKSEPNNDSFMVRSHLMQVLGGLNSLRNEGVLCDVTICVDSTEFMCHRVVLASCSSYFKAMFSVDLRESHQDKVYMQDIEAETMKLLIDYVYTSNLLITAANVQSLSFAANLMEMRLVRDACGKFMEKHMDESNCIGVYCVAEALDDVDLKRKSRDFILRNFNEVSKQEELLLLPKRLLVELVSSESLNVASEEVVFDILMRWYHHDEDSRRDEFHDVLEHVRLPLLSPAYVLNKVMTEDVISQSDKCMKLLNETSKYHSLHDRRLELLCTYRQIRVSSADAHPGIPLWQVGPGIIDMDYLPNGDIVTACVSGIHVYDINSRKMEHPLSELCRGNLEALCVDRSRAFVVVAEHSLSGCSSLYMWGKYGDRWTKKLYHITQKPRYLACTTDGEVIVGTYNNKLLRYNAHGEVVWHKQPSCGIYAITVDHNNRLLICHDDYVTVYNPAGDQLFSFPKDSEERDLDPWGICVDSNDNILLADGVSNSVLLFSSEGKYMGQLLKLKTRMRHIALHDDQYLCVCGDDEQLYMYKI